MIPNPGKLDLTTQFFKRTSFNYTLNTTILETIIKLEKWKSFIKSSDTEKLSQKMKSINPKYTLREWFLVPAYQQANEGNYTLLKELQEVMTQPYEEQSTVIENKYYKLKPSELFAIAGVSHVSCSS